MHRSEAVGAAPARAADGAAVTTYSAPRRYAMLAVLVWRSAAGYASLYAVITVLLGFMPVVSARATQGLLDGLIPGSTTRHLVVAYAVTLVLAAAVTTIGPTVNRYADSALRRRIALTMYDEVFRGVNRLTGLRKFESPEYLDKVRLAQQSTQMVPGQIVGGGFGLAQALVSAGGFFVTLVVINPILALVVLGAAVPSAIAQRRLGTQRTGMMLFNSPALRRQIFYSSLLTDLHAVKEVRLFGLGDFLRGRALAETRAIQRQEQAVDQSVLRTETVFGAIGAVISGAGLVWAVHAAVRGELSVGTIVLLLMAIVAVQTALGSAAGRIGDLSGAAALFGHFLAVSRTTSDLPIAADPVALPALTGTVELRDVWFRYGEDRPWILRGVDLTVEPGRILALVGLNGAGKSTLIKLLCRLYDPDRGAIYWNGVDIRECDPQDLRRRIGTVFQDYMVYDLSAAENIGVGDLPALDDRARIEDAAQLAGIGATVEALPRGYDTLLSRTFMDEADRTDSRAGVALSGGQWQRIALARGLMRNRADLLILDEPTSGLDAEAEHDMHARLVRHRSGHTTVLVSHRLGAVRDADMIAVLEDGAIVESGDHDQLMALGGRYAALFTLQSAGYQSVQADAVEVDAVEPDAVEPDAVGVVV